MKSSSSGATAVFRDFAGWFAAGSEILLPDAERVPFVSSARGCQWAQPGSDLDMSRNRWVPGVRLDNFS